MTRLGITVAVATVAASSWAVLRSNASEGLVLASWFVAVLCSLSLAESTNGVERDPFHPNVAFRIITLLALVLPVPKLVEDRVVREQTGFGILILAVLFLGTIVLVNRWLGETADSDLREAACSPTGPVVRRVLAAVLAAGWASRVYSVATGNLQGTFVGTGIELTASSNALGQLNGLPYLAVIGFAAFGVRWRTVLLLAAAELSWSMFSGSKASALSVGLPLALHWHRTVGVARTRLLVVGGAIGIALVLAFPFIDAYRTRAGARLATTGSLTWSDLTAVAGESVGDGVDVPGSEDATLGSRINWACFFGLLVDSGLGERPWHGQSLSPIAIWWIPRAIWTDKPIVSIGGWYAREVLGWPDDAPGEGAITIWGDGFMSFGWPGAVLFGIAFVAVMTWLYARLRAGGRWGAFCLGAVYVRMLLGLEQNLATPLVSIQQTLLVIASIFVVSSAIARLGPDRETAVAGLAADEHPTLDLP